MKLKISISIQLIIMSFAKFSLSSEYDAEFKRQKIV